ncbi:hypothetical protein P3T16_002300 [Paraburkholderia sp. GAS42]
MQEIRATRAKVVTAPRSNRKTKRYYCGLYRTRNLVERFFNRIKHFRRVSTRYDKLADSYLVFASLACAFGPVVNVNITWRTDTVHQVYWPGPDLTGSRLRASALHIRFPARVTKVAGRCRASTCCAVATDIADTLIIGRTR